MTEAGENNKASVTGYGVGAPGYWEMYGGASPVDFFTMILSLIQRVSERDGVKDCGGFYPMRVQAPQMRAPTSPPRNFIFFFKVVILVNSQNSDTHEDFCSIVDRWKIHTIIGIIFLGHLEHRGR